MLMKPIHFTNWRFDKRRLSIDNELEGIYKPYVRQKRKLERREESGWPSTRIAE
jgi:hypothetical protein